MADEEAVTPQEPTAPAAAPTEEAGGQAEEVAEPEVGWDVIERALDKVPAEQLRKHKRFAGILGGSLQQAQVAWERERFQQAQREAAAKAEQELIELAQNDPIAFAERFQSQYEADKARASIENMRQDTARQYMHEIGKTFSSTFSLTEEEIGRIGEALAGKKDDEILATFNVAVAKLVTEREAQKMFAEWRDKELPKEREAIKKELSGERIRGEVSPSIRRSVLPSTLKPHQLPDDKFDEWYEDNVLRPARSFTGR